nr:hypothetical protein CFP56_66440 [Quercus suber]
MSASSTQPSQSFVLWPSVREFHQHALLTPLCLMTIGVSASSAQPSQSLRLVAISTRVPLMCPSHCLHLTAFNTGVPSARPSHCPHLAAISARGSSVHPSDCLCQCLRPMIISARASSSYHSHNHCLAAIISLL